MFRVTVQPSYDNTLFRMKLMCNNEVMGIIVVFKYPELENHAILHIYIRLKYRKRWLASKHFASKIFRVFVNIAHDKNIEFVHSAALKPESARLLDYFHFKHYEDNLYCLNVTDFKN